MKKTGIVKKTFKSMINVRRWVAWDDITNGGRLVGSIFKRVFVPYKAEHHESYMQAVQRLNLSQEDIKQRQQWFFRLSMVYLLLAVIIFIYAIYLAIHAHIMSAFLCICLIALVLVYAYREHFWYTQIKYQKFGCTFKDWWALNFKSNKVTK